MNHDPTVSSSSPVSPASSSSIAASPVGPVLLDRVEQVADLMEVPFTPAQQEAIGAPLEPMVVMAGAGAGKTAVMAARVVWLVGSGQVTAEQVLGLTFTNKAATELAERVRSALERLQGRHRLAPGEDDPAAGAQATVSTYHAYASRLLTEQGLRLGLEPDARLLDDALRLQLALRVVRGARGPFPSFDRSPSRIAALLLALDGELNEHLVAPDDVRAHGRALMERIDGLARVTAGVRDLRAAAATRHDLLDLVETFRARKRAMNLVDFGDQLALAAQLVAEHPEVARQERERFAVVLLDEYQDTSVAQKRLLLDLFGDGHPVTAVGDPFQSIYGWRGASVRNILSFREEFTGPDGAPARLVGLPRNNRSHELILTAANAVAAPLRVELPALAPLEPRPDHAGRGEVRTAVHLRADDEVEAGADLLADLVAQGRRPRELAVLSRTTREIAPWYAALVGRGIPVEVVGLGGLLALPEIVDLVSVLRVLDDPTANPALLRQLVGPRWRWGPADLRALGVHAARLARERRVPVDDPDDADARLDAALAEAVAGRDDAELVALVDGVLDADAAGLTPEALARARAWAAEFERLRGLLALPLPDLVAAVISAIGLDVEVAVRDGAERRSESLAAFVQAAADFSDLDGQATLRAFLGHLDVVAQDDRGLGGGSPSGDDAVTLMTIHAAKGLEFPVVLLPDVTEGVFPSTRSRSSWLTDPGALPAALRGDAADYPGDPDLDGDKGIKAYKARLRELSLAEETRLAYVALTRAKELLILSSHWWGRAQKKPRGPAPFLRTVREACAGDPGYIALIDVPPPVEESNPFLDDDRGHAWPTPIDDDRAARLTAAAEAVRARLADPPPLAPGAPPPGASSQVQAWHRDAAVLVEELQALHAPVTEAALPVALTASAVVELGRDPDAFARRLRRPMPRPPAKAAGRGTRFHLWVEQRFGQRPLIDRFELAGAADDALDPDDGELRALQEAFEAGPFADRAPLEIEAPFRVVIGGRVIRGRIDAVYRTDDGFDVIDWKTGRTPSDPVQLAIYRLGWAARAAVPVEQVTAGFYRVRDGAVERPDLPDEEELAALLGG